MGAGLKARNLLRKKYPLIISDERVSLSHLNLMTLGWSAGVLLGKDPVYRELELIILY